jgi:hypothetical protein
MLNIWTIKLRYKIWKTTTTKKTLKYNNKNINILHNAYNLKDNILSD